MPRTVLFVDDEPHLLAIISKALANEPYRVLTAESAEEALVILEKERVDVVVSDEIMPGMAGTDFLEVVRERHPTTIRMILTAYPVLKKALMAVEEGRVHHFFTKPFNIVDLAINIRQAFRQKEFRRGARLVLDLVRRQSAILRDLRKRCTGVVSVPKDKVGMFDIDDADFIDLDEIVGKIEDIEKEVKEAEASFEELLASQERSG